MHARCFLSLILVGAACGGDASSNDGGGSGSSGSTASDDGATTTGGDGDGGAGSTSDDDGDDTTGSSMDDATTGAMGSEDSGSSESTGGAMVGTPGCRVATPLAEGQHTFMLDGYDRRYILRLPSNYSPDQPWPLIFALHGNGGDTNYWDTIGGDRDIRTAFGEEAILVIPEAINHQWRDYGADPSTWPMFMDLELAYFDEVYQQATEELCIDTSNVFSMGFSGGGSFSGVLGCRREWVRAIAVGGSVIYFDEADCTETPAAWITIGQLEYNQGREDFLYFFRDHAGCMETSMDGDPAGCVDYDGCGAGTPVTYCSHAGDHVWPSIGTDATKAFFESFYQ